MTDSATAQVCLHMNFSLYNYIVKNETNKKMKNEPNVGSRYDLRNSIT